MQISRTPNRQQLVCRMLSAHLFVFMFVTCGVFSFIFFFNVVYNTMGVSGPVVECGA